MKESEIVKAVTGLYDFRFPRLILHIIKEALNGKTHVVLHRIKFEELVRWDEMEGHEQKCIEYLRGRGFLIKYQQDGHYYIDWKKDWQFWD